MQPATSAQRPPATSAMFLTLFASIGLILGPTLPAKAAPCAAVTHARSSPPCLELQLGMVDWGVQTPPSDTQLATIKGTWGTWGCGISTFPWTYSDEEWCFILEGEVTVTPDDADKFGGPKQIKQGGECPHTQHVAWTVQASAHASRSRKKMPLLIAQIMSCCPRECLALGM